jgi:hypothetical protein
VSEGGSPEWKAKTRLPFEKERLSVQGGAKSASLVLYALLAIACAGAALYMGLVVRHPVLSAYVMAPAIGAVWFLTRLVMMLSPKR